MWLVVVMGNGCGGNGNCCGNNNVGDININRMAVAAGPAMMMTRTAAVAAVTLMVTMSVTMMVVAALAEVASVAEPMVRAKANPQPHPIPHQYLRFIPFWNIPLIHSVNGSDNGGDEGSDINGGGGNGARRNGSCGR